MAWITTKNLKKFADGFSKKAMLIFAKLTDIPDSLPANGGDADTVSGHTVESDVPAGAKFTDTKSVVMSGATDSQAGTSGLAPAPAKGQQDYFLKGDGTWGKLEEATEADIAAIIAGTFN